MAYGDGDLGIVRTLYLEVEIGCQRYGAVQSNT